MRPMPLQQPYATVPILLFAAVTGPGARNLFRQLKRSGDVLADTWINLLLVHNASAQNMHAIVNLMLTTGARYRYQRVCQQCD
jgi:hypothetical protein